LLTRHEVSPIPTANAPEIAIGRYRNGKLTRLGLDYAGQMNCNAVAVARKRIFGIYKKTPKCKMVVYYLPDSPPKHSTSKHLRTKGAILAREIPWLEGFLSGAEFMFTSSPCGWECQ
jgi:hypothetical protein